MAGTGTRASAGDGGPAAEASLITPRNLATDAAGNLYVSEFEGHRVRRIAPDGRISTVVATGVPGLLGDGAQASQSLLNFPAGLAIDRAGSLYIADSGNGRIRKIVAGGAIVSIEGTQKDALTSAGGGDRYRRHRVCSGREAAPQSARTDRHLCSAPGDWEAPHDLVTDSSGNLYIADGMRVRRMDARGQVQTLAGDAYTRALGDGGPALAASLWKPAAVALDSAGRLLIADSGTAGIRQVTPAGSIATLAGGPDANPALGNPMGVAS